MRTCSACGTTGQPEAARFCFSCGSSMGAPLCDSCGAEVVVGARFCSSCGAVQGVEAAPASVTARRVTSVLFGDLVGFTSLSESRDQEDVRELLSRYFDECRAIVSRYGGTVEKFIGDAVMAVWGVPTSHEDDAERAVRAGLELVDVVTAIGDELDIEDLAMRVGIVTGEVAVTVGALQQGMVAGDAVNTAARVQSAATPGQVWVDETTRLLTSSAISYVDVGSHAMKGKADPLPLWSVRAVIANVGGGQRADGLEAPHVGRDRDLRVVKELFHGVEEGRRPAMLVVSGEAGVGKTRLAWEFEKYLDGLSTSVRWHSGRCLSYGEGVAFYALAEAIRGRLQALSPEDESPDQEGPGSLLSHALDVLLVDAEERSWLEPRVAALLGIGAVGQFQREDLFNAWATFLERVGGDGLPVLLVIDDAQHIDEGLLSFLEHLTAVGSFALFVLLLARPSLLDERPTLAANRRVTVLHLETLPDTEMARLLDGLVAGLPESVRSALVDRADGIPLYAVETVRSLIDRDLVLPRGGQYVLADEQLDLDDIGAPASLHALMSARLDALPAEQRRVVDVASVLGTTFTRSQIEALCPEIDIDAALAALVRAQVLRQESDRLSAERGQYQFMQSVIRQVAIGTLARRDRKALHLAVAELLEAGDTSAELASIVAQHLLEAAEAVEGAPDGAELTAAAVGQLRRAATRAGSLGAPGEASGHLELALQRAEDPAEQRELEAALAVYLQRAGRHEEATAHAIAARDAFEAAGDLVAAGSAVVTLVRARGLALGHFDECRQLVNEWMARLADDPAASRVLLGLALVHTTIEVRLYGEPVPSASEAVRLAELVGTPAEVAESYVGLGVAYQVQGLQGPGEVLIEAATRMARDARDPRVLVRALMNCCAFAVGKDGSAAVGYGREALSIALTMGDQDWLDATIANLSRALLLAGEWDELAALGGIPGATLWRVVLHAMCAEAASARGNDAHWPASSEDISLEHFARLCQARTAQLSGDLAEAGRLAVESARLAAELSGHFDDFPVVFWLAGDIAQFCEPQVTRDLLALIPPPHEIRPPVGTRAQAALLRARLAEVDGVPADEHYAEALALHEEWRAAAPATQARAQYGAWLARQGRAGEAASVLAAARAELEALGATRWLTALDGQLAGVAS